MMRTNAILLLGTMILFMFGCDKVELPVPAPIVVEGVDSARFPSADTAAMNTSFRKTCVEEYTGHKCTTCPANTELLLQQVEENKGRMVVVSVHAGSFALVQPPDFPTDFNTKYGDEIFLHLTEPTTPIPSAIINRRTFPEYNNYLIFNQTTTFWNKPIDLMNQNTSTDFAIGIAADYFEESDELYVTVSAKTLVDVSGDYRLLVLAVEDSIVAEQLDTRADPDIYPGKIVTDYTHRHVLRAKLSSDQSLSGNPMILGGASGQTWFEQKIYTGLPTNVSNVKHLHIVAHIINAGSEEVMQSEEAHVHVVE